MKIKRYLVKDMHEAYNVIRRDLGPDAVLINTRQVRDRGPRGWFKPAKLEVTAAVDNYPPEAPTVTRPDNKSWSEGIDELKQLVQQLVVTRDPEGEPRSETRGEYWRQVVQQLEINHTLSEKIIASLHADMSNGEGSVSRPEAALTRCIADLLPHPGQRSPGRIQSLVGPTGVGKTTTLAKLAAHHALFNHRRVALITIDTYRIGAVEQLRTYGEIIGIPVEVVFTPEELAKVVQRHQDKDLLLMDTIGRPSHNLHQVQELKRFIDAIAPVETFLVLSCTTKDRDLQRIIQDYRLVQYDQLIFTKVDETQSLGCILNTAYQAQVPVAYLTNGQVVPDDLAIASPAELAKLIMGAVNHA